MRMAKLAVVCWVVLFILTEAAVRPFKEKVENSVWIDPTFKRVTKKEQLWRFLVGEGSEGVTAGDKYLCLKSPEDTYLQSNHERAIDTISKTCGKDQRWEPILKENDQWVLKLYKADIGLSCWNGNAVGYRIYSRTPTRVTFSDIKMMSYDAASLVLYISPNEDKLVLLEADRGGLITTRWNDDSVDCQDDWKDLIYFYGWKEGKEDDWKAKDGEETIVDCDNSDPSSPSSMDCTYKKTVGRSKTEKTSEMTSVSIGVEAEKSFGNYFKMKITSSFKHDWSKESSETFSSSTTVEVKYSVLPGYHVKIVQAVGTIGMFEFRSSKVRTIVVKKPDGVDDTTAYELLAEENRMLSVT